MPHLQSGKWNDGQTRHAFHICCKTLLDPVVLATLDFNPILLIGPNVAERFYFVGALELT